MAKTEKKKQNFQVKESKKKRSGKEKKNFRIAVLQDELTTRRFWLERAKEQGNQEEIRLQEEEIKNIIEELKELGVEVEEEEKIAA